MPVKTGSSHGLALLVCTILAAFLVDLLRPVIPQGMAVFQMLAERVESSVEISIDARQLAVTMFAAALAFAWGVFFRLRQRQR